MRFRLRTLLIVLALGPPIIAWFVWSRQRAADEQVRSQLVTLGDGVKLYVLDVSQLPPDLDALLQPPPTMANPQRWQGPYLERTPIPFDPWGSSFQYKRTGKRLHSFQLSSPGPDRRFATRDDIIVEY
jgi:general secretion pathway protein G